MSLGEAAEVSVVAMGTAGKDGVGDGGGRVPSTRESCLQCSSAEGVDQGLGKRSGMPQAACFIVLHSKMLGNSPLKSSSEKGAKMLHV